jgi:putative oxidoreductase
MKSKFSMSCKEWGMFILRLVVGAVFIAHGWSKLQNLPMIVGFFGSLGLAPFFAYLVAWTEFVSGIALLVGIFTRLAGYLVAIVMVCAIYFAKFKMGFLGGYELELTLLASALALAWNGPGKVSVAKMVCGCDNCMLCGGAMMGKKAIGGKCDNCENCKDNCTKHE